MTNPIIDSTGVTVQTLQEILTELEDSFKGIYGTDLDLSQNTPDGQRLGILAKISADLQAYGLSLYDLLDPDFAIGEMMNKIIKIAGITRNPATRSSVEETIVVDRNLALASGYKARDENNQNWVTTSDSTLTTGSNTVTMYAEFFGNYEAGAGEITEPVTIILGVTSVTNAAAAVAGVDEETDEELRIRRNKSLENPSYSTVGGLYAKLVDLEGVTDLQVYENDLSTTDSVRGMVPHSIWVVIEGGDTADIVEVLAKSKTSGTSQKGSESGTYIETLTTPDGSTRTINHTMLYDRPTDVDLFVELTVTRKDASIAIDKTLIKSKLAAIDWTVRESATATELYAAVYSAGATFIATDLQISLTLVGGYTDESLEPGYDEKFVIETANVTITEV